MGQPVAVDQRQRPDQAEQHQPRLNQHGVRGRDALRVNRHDPAGDQHGKGAVAADEKAGQDHAGAAHRHGEDPGQLHPRGGAGPPGHQRHRRQQQRDSGRLDDNKIPVWRNAGRQAQRTAEIRPVVVLGDAQQKAWAGGLVVHAQRERQRRGHRDYHGDRGNRPALGRRGRPGIAQCPARDLAFCHFAHNQATPRYRPRAICARLCRTPERPAHTARRPALCTTRGTIPAAAQIVMATWHCHAGVRLG